MKDVERSQYFAANRELRAVTGMLLAQKVRPKPDLHPRPLHDLETLKSIVVHFQQFLTRNL